MSTGSTIAIVVGAGIFLILAGIVLLVINRLSVSGDRISSASGNRGIGSLTEPTLIVAGVACLVVCVIVNGSHSTAETTGPSSSSTAPTASAPIQSSSSTSTPSTSGSNLASSPLPAGSAENVSVSSPKTGSQVEACQVFAGTSNLASDKTIVLSVSNLSDPTKTLYLAPVHNWQTSNMLSHWTGVQYFGSGNSSVGQTFHVDVVIMDISQVRQALAISSNHPTWSTAARPAGSQVKEELSLTRISGLGPTSCR